MNSSDRKEGRKGWGVVKCVKMNRTLVVASACIAAVLVIAAGPMLYFSGNYSLRHGATSGAAVSLFATRQSGLVAEWAGEQCQPSLSASDVKEEIRGHPDVGEAQAKLLQAVKQAGAVAGSQSVFIDIGANKGEFSREMAKVWPGQQHYTFEMMPKMQKLIQKTVRDHVAPERLHQIQRAVSDTSGQKVDVLGAPQATKWDSWTMFSLLHRPPDGGKTFDSVVGHVETVSIGEWADSPEGIGRDADIPFMKIDTEGLDGMVLRGMTKPYDLLGSGKIKAIFFELNRISLQTDMKPKEQFELLSQKGYDTYLFTPLRLIRISDECFSADDHLDKQLYTRNAVALPKGLVFSCCVLTLYDQKDRGCACE